MTATALAVTSKHEGHSGLRLLFNDNSYTLIANDGRTVCLRRKCIDARLPACEHTEIVKALTPAEIEAIPLCLLHRVSTDA